MPRSPSYLLLRDLGIVAVSVVAAFLLAYTDTMEQLLRAAQGLGILGNFFIGIFYTSVFTSVPATVALGKIAQVQPVLLTALLGGAGALVGDYLIFRFVRDSISPLLAAHSARIRNISAHPFFRWVLMALGALIVASPLPDEPGLVLIGLSHAKTAWFAPFSFLANATGILVIGIIARAI
ncbi:MAG: hypothetical protein HYW65_02645 [Candidatus Liptonbacteria bacterium]|nr:hypothetical protein [Candidatus Liptonbacteria bacterium]